MILTLFESANVRNGEKFGEERIPSLKITRRAANLLAGVKLLCGKIFTLI
jgi:hypothetical protein